MVESVKERKGEAILKERGWTERLEDGRAEGEDGGAGEPERWNATNGGAKDRRPK